MRKVFFSIGSGGVLLTLAIMMVASPRYGLARCETAPNGGRQTANCGAGRPNSSTDADSRIRALQLSIKLFQQAIEDDQKQVDQPDAQRARNRQRNQAKILAEKKRYAALMKKQLKELQEIDEANARKEALRERARQKENQDRLRDFKVTGETEANPWANSSAEERRIACTNWQIKAKLADDAWDKCMRGELDPPHMSGQNAKSAAASGKVSTIANKHSKSSDRAALDVSDDEARSGATSNPKTGEGCITVSPGEVKRGISVYDNKPFLAYPYKVVNSCNRPFKVKLVTRAGWDNVRNVGANASIEWKCSDGFFSSKDCKGGLATYSYN